MEHLGFDSNKSNIEQHGTFNGVRYTISNHMRGVPDIQGGRGIWCYYVYITDLILSPADFEEFWLTPRPEKNSLYSDPNVHIASYDYWAPKWADVYWHGGVTFYKKVSGFDGENRIVKIGCDFNHLYDTGWQDFEDVEREAQRTIKELQAMYPFINYDELKRQEYLQRQSDAALTKAAQGAPTQQAEEK